ncbi:hypothetical protein ASPWEDRAFT_177763 [Aspergillus wentii DTO 134E9]|uniref:Cytochrome b561 domain-containing protein n=1 Tax=Aspergillus wentii DTO 134E9 TaxID=1073089 RepID=A0A1L9R559_ASPWE|nr:uncharacterized protein ASPWEDRAFT_177763 [Aspergillus wentii DTO 134E9]KAI9927302.1 hypothetical protein MW887_003689 [Aspergillus wentii]OJJ30032.1 hypothetical protein ASPWEDRAFT_177763 [Aspergillus wentii DTO 134E9]
MKFETLLIALGLGSFPLAVAQVVIFTASDQNVISYSIGVPNTTASSGSGPIFLQMKAPSTIQWFALGQGAHMAGANIFVVYSSSSSDKVTISPRLAKSHIEPEYNPDARISLLQGSGIQNGVMTANVRCDTCIQWNGGSLDPGTSSSNWIWSYREGIPLSSNNVTEDIRIHDHFGRVIVDLTKATDLNASNPFLGASLDPSSNDFTAVPPSSSNGPHKSRAILIAHGLVMSFAFVIFFPTFALLIPIPWAVSVSKVHAPLQIFTLTLSTAGMGMGIWLGVDGSQISNAHPIIGLLVVGSLIFLQPLMGFLQHLHFRQTGEKSFFSYSHRWFGRIMIILGVFNGGLGFRLAGFGSPGTPRSAMIAYSVISGVVGLTYLAVHAFTTWRSGKGAELSGARDNREN